MDKEIKVGDWVRGYAKGIWQVYRILTYKAFDPDTEIEQPKTTIFLKRFLNNSFKISLSEACCDPFFIEQIDSETRTKLTNFINQNPNLLERFNNYFPKPIIAGYDARIKIPEDKDIDKVTKELSTDRLIPENEIDSFLKDKGYYTDDFPAWTARFTNNDFEMKDNRLIYKFDSIFDF